MLKGLREWYRARLRNYILGIIKQDSEKPKQDSKEQTSIVFPPSGAPFRNRDSIRNEAITYCEQRIRDVSRDLNSVVQSVKDDNIRLRDEVAETARVTFERAQTLNQETEAAIRRSKRHQVYIQVIGAVVAAGLVGGFFYYLKNNTNVGTLINKTAEAANLARSHGTQINDLSNTFYSANAQTKSNLNLRIDTTASALETAFQKGLTDLKTNTESIVQVINNDLDFASYRLDGVQDSITAVGINVKNWYNGLSSAINSNTESGIRLQDRVGQIEREINVFNTGYSNELIKTRTSLRVLERDYDDRQKAKTRLTEEKIIYERRLRELERRIEALERGKHSQATNNVINPR